VGSTILNRLFFHRGLPAPLLPTLAIELAPPAVAGIAYFALTGDRTDYFAHALAGYAALMAVVQVRMLPRFLRLRFVPGFWAFVFSWAATATYALEWIALRRPAGADGYAVAILTLISAFVAVIVMKTAVLIRRGKLLPPREVPRESPPEVSPNAGVASQAGAGSMN
jgi:tellurite resistance protein